MIQGLSYVAAAAASLDSPRGTGPVDTVSATNFTNGLSTWNLDAVNVTNGGFGRTTTWTGAGVNVAVLDTGLVDNWKQYFPQERILSQASEPVGNRPEEYAAFIQSEIVKWRAVIKQANMKPD